MFVRLAILLIGVSRAMGQGGPQALLPLRIPAGAAVGQSVLWVSLPLSGTSSTKGEPILTDTIDSNSSIRVSFSSRGHADIDTQRLYYFDAGVSGAPVNSFHVERTALLTVDSNSKTIAYSLTNQIQGPNNRLVAITPNEWATSGTPMPIIIVTGDLPATKVGIATALVEAKSKVALRESAIELCASSAAACDSSIVIPANSTQAVYLRYIGEMDPGIYNATAKLYSPEYPNATDLRFTAYVSSIGCRVFGIMCVVTGALLAWWTRVYANNRIARDQALLPLAICCEQLSALKARLSNVEIKLNVRC
jgi:hypothetical protein